MKSSFKVLSLCLFFSSLALDNLTLTPEQQAYVDQITADAQESSKDFSSLNVVKVVHENYKKEVLESDKPVLILVSASWCPPCQLFKPIFYRVATEHPSIFKFVNIEYDSFPEFVQGQKLEGVPMLILCHKGEILDRAPGFMTKQDFINCIDSIAQSLL